MLSAGFTVEGKRDMSSPFMMSTICWGSRFQTEDYINNSTINMKKAVNKRSYMPYVL